MEDLINKNKYNLIYINFKKQLIYYILPLQTSDIEYNY